MTTKQPSETVKSLTMIRVAVITNVVPRYRKAFFDKLGQNGSLELTVYCQAEIKDTGLATVRMHPSVSVRIVRSWQVGRETLVWQHLPWCELYRNYDVYVFLGNPRHLSSVFLATTLRTLGRPVVLWGQVHTAGAPAWSEWLRLRWWKMFDYLLTYSKSEAKQLRRRGFVKQTIEGLNNGLDQDEIDAVSRQWSQARLENWAITNELEGRTILLSCARLEAKNRFERLVQVLPDVIQSVPGVLWCAIGDGSCRSQLIAEANRRGLSRHIRWLGAIADERELAPWFLNAHVLVHPGAIGLTLLHAFGYGLPVITHDRLNDHMPEVAALQSMQNAVLFRANDLLDMRRKIIQVIVDENLRESLRSNALRTARDQFNIGIMVQQFMKLIDATQRA